MNNLHNLLQPKEKITKKEIQIKIKDKIGIIGIHISLLCLIRFKRVIGLR